MRLYQEAYTEGVTDASMQYTALLESQRRQHLVMGVIACAVTLCLTYLYGSAKVAQSESFAAEHLQAQRELLTGAHTELQTTKSALATVVESAKAKDLTIARQRRELVRAAEQRRVVQRHVWRLRHQSRSVRQQMAQLHTQMEVVQRRLTIGVGAMAVVWVGTVWWLGRQRAYHASRVLATEE